MTCPDKFWMPRHGTIGTAHWSRDGRVVDFRPATVVKKAVAFVGRLYESELDDDLYRFVVTLEATDGSRRRLSVDAPIAWGPWEATNEGPAWGRPGEKRAGVTTVAHDGAVLHDGPVPSNWESWCFRSARGGMGPALDAARRDAALVAVRASPLDGLSARAIGRLFRPRHGQREAACEHVLDLWSTWHSAPLRSSLSHDEVTRLVLQADRDWRTKRHEAWMARKTT